MRRAGNLKAIVQIEHGVKDRVAIRNVHDGTIRKHEANPLQEHFPLVVAVKIVGHEEAAAQQILAHHLGFLLGEAPFAHLHGVDPRPVERLVAVFHHDGLLHGAHLNARQTPHGLRKMAVGARIILGPERQALAEVAIEAARIAVVRAGWKHQPREGPLARRLPVRRELKVEIFDAGKLAEGLLERAQSAPRKTKPHPSKHAALRPIIGSTHPENSIRAGLADCYTGVLNRIRFERFPSGFYGSSRRALTAGFLGWTLDAFDFFLVTLCLTAIGKEFHKSDSAIALSITATLAFRPVGAFLFGLLADRYGRRLPLMIDLVFYSVCEVLTGLAPNYTTFLVLRALFGIGMGGEWGVGASLAMEKVPPRLRGVLSGLLQEGYAAGNLLAAIAYFFLFQRWGWRPLFFLGGLPALLALVRPFPREGIRGLEEKPRRKLERAGARHRIALEAVPVPHAADDDDELRLARYAGHVSDFPGTAVALRTVAALGDHRHFDDRRDCRRHRDGASVGPLWPPPRDGERACWAES